MSDLSPHRIKCRHMSTLLFSISIRFDQSNDPSSEGGMDMDGRKEGGKRSAGGSVGAFGAVTGHCSVQSPPIAFCSSSDGDH